MAERVLFHQTTKCELCLPIAPVEWQKILEKSKLIQESQIVPKEFKVPESPKIPREAQNSQRDPKFEERPKIS